MAVIKVKLRQKPIKGNLKSLYLDFYPHILDDETGKPTRRKFLGLYLNADTLFEVQKYFDKKGNEKEKIVSILDEKGEPTKIKLHPLEVQHNKEKLQLAEQIRRTKEKELNQNEALSNIEKNFIEREKKTQIKEAKELLKGEENFVTYFKSIAEKREKSNLANWNSTYIHLFNFTNGVLKLANLNEQFCNDFKEYLLTTTTIKSKDAKLSQNSAVSYFNKFKSALKKVYKDGKININLNDKIDCIPIQETIKHTLTIEELNLLAKAECESPLLKKIVLFSALTGMPYKEMENLKWEQTEVSESFGIRIKMRRQKSDKPLYTYISKDAYNLLGERKEPKDKVFEGIKNKDRFDLFSKWLTKVGIKKKMTFHDLRHTYGCLQIELGTDLYTVQGNMGHSTSRQTMLYAKVSDQRKREAANKIKLNF